jgi:hypothetical protein
MTFNPRKDLKQLLHILFWWIGDVIAHKRFGKGWFPIPFKIRRRLETFFKLKIAWRLFA